MLRSKLPPFPTVFLYGFLPLVVSSSIYCWFWTYLSPGLVSSLFQVFSYLRSVPFAICYPFCPPSSGIRKILSVFLVLTNFFLARSGSATSSLLAIPFLCADFYRRYTACSEKKQSPFPQRAKKASSVLSLRHIWRYVVTNTLSSSRAFPATRLAHNVSLLVFFRWSASFPLSRALIFFCSYAETRSP